MGRARVVLGVVLGLLATGVLIGALWVWLAPSIHGVVGLNHSGERAHDYLGNESEHFFVAPFLMLGLLSVVAVVVPVLTWQWPQHRGPMMVAGLSIGLTGAAATASAVGALGAQLRYGALNIAAIPLSADHRLQYFIEAPPVFFGHSPWQVACSLLLPAGTGALVYALLVAGAAHDDLGDDPTEDAKAEIPESPPIEAPVTADGGAPLCP